MKIRNLFHRKGNFELTISEEEFEKIFYSWVELDPEKRKRHPILGDVNTEKNFEGAVYGGRFSINRIHVKSHFVPELKGEALLFDNISHVDYKIKLSNLKLITFILFNLVGIVFLFISILSGKFLILIIPLIIFSVSLITLNSEMNLIEKRFLKEFGASS